MEKKKTNIRPNYLFKTHGTGTGLEPKLELRSIDDFTILKPSPSSNQGPLEILYSAKQKWAEYLSQSVHVAMIVWLVTLFR